VTASRLSGLGVAVFASNASAGGKQRLGVITKGGDSYLRGLLLDGCGQRPPDTIYVKDHLQIYTDYNNDHK
jgi:hypothetical protein